MDALKGAVVPGSALPAEERIELLERLLAHERTARVADQRIALELTQTRDAAQAADRMVSPRPDVGNQMTPKGSVPHRPEFGSDIWRYLDLPTDEAVPHVIREGIAALHQAAGGSFGKANAAKRLAVVKSIEGQPFFNTVRGQCITSLYDNDMAFKVLGYPGSAWEKGGYITRGFQDLKWLPAPPLEASPKPYLGCTPQDKQETRHGEVRLRRRLGRRHHRFGCAACARGVRRPGPLAKAQSGGRPDRESRRRENGRRCNCLKFRLLV